MYGWTNKQIRAMTYEVQVEYLKGDVEAVGPNGEECISMDSMPKRINDKLNRNGKKR